MADVMLWSYESEAHRVAGACPPERLCASYGAQAPDSPFRQDSYASAWRAIEAGYCVSPADCPPIRLMARYGFVAKSPGRVTIRRSLVKRAERQFEQNRAAYGLAEIEGDSWPSGDSGLIASWISGSEFVKLYTGIKVLFSRRSYLFQGPLPNELLVRRESHRVMAGLEFSDGRNVELVNGREYGVARLNAVIHLPPEGEMLCISRGEPILWFYPTDRAIALEARDESVLSAGDGQ